MRPRGCTLLAATLLALSKPAVSQTQEDPTPSTVWPSYSSLNTIFAFGDSYTTTGFLPNGTQPSLANPFGNPELPGRTFSNGRNWLTFLTTQYNTSFIRTYNFAMGSAIVDSFGVPYPFRPLREQVEQFFLPNYGGGPNGTGRVRWRSDETLFVFFFGINDVNGAVMQARNSTSNTTNSDAATFLDSTLSRIVSAYDRHIETLYTSGARNYMFLTVPAIHRAPASVVQGEEVVEALRVAVLDFNDRIRNMVVEMLRRHADAAAFILDTFALFDEVLDEPESRVETGVYRNTTGFCEAYARYPRSRNEEETSPECPLAQKEYFWLDSLHPTPPTHEAMAAEIQLMLQNDRFIDRETGNVSSGSSRTYAPAFFSCSKSWKTCMGIVFGMMWTSVWLL